MTAKVTLASLVERLDRLELDMQELRLDSPTVIRREWVVEQQLASIIEERDFLRYVVKALIPSEAEQ